MNTRYLRLSFVMVLGLGLSGAVRAAPAPSEEFPIQRVFFPSVGYDDNDNVQIMLEGALPDVCYVVGEHTFNVDPASHVITAHQFAWRRKDGPCDTGDLLPDSEFSEEVSLGRLAAGDYLVNFFPESGGTQTKKLHVDPAKTTALDDFNYARVTSLLTAPLNLENKPVKFTIRGLLSSICNTIHEPIVVKVVGDTIVVQPVEEAGPACVPVPGDMGLARAFEKTIDLGVLGVGEYLAHVRSKGGRAVEQTFEVLKPL